MGHPGIRVPVWIKDSGVKPSGFFRNPNAGTCAALRNCELLDVAPCSSVLLCCQILQAVQPVPALDHAFCLVAIPWTLLSWFYPPVPNSSPSYLLPCISSFTLWSLFLILYILYCIYCIIVRLLGILSLVYCSLVLSSAFFFKSIKK